MRAVQRSGELDRILRLPRRTWNECDAERVAAELTEILKTPDGTMSLRPIQAIALVELAQCKGLFAPIRVGGGKTLITALAAVMVGAERPLLLVPAKLVEKTRRELIELRKHWRIPDLIRVMSYELLGQPQSGAVLDREGRIVTPDVLERYLPDLIIGDEGHKLRRFTSAVTKRVTRYLKKHPDCILVVLSGTFATRSILDYGHLAARALNDGAPIPRVRNQREDWSAALDSDEPTVELGALTLLGGHDVETVRHAYRDRLLQTCGFIVHDVPFRGVGLSISPLPLEPPPTVLSALEMLRDRWELPDGSKLVEALELWRAMRQIALGLFYKWDPAPPQDWLQARSEWSSMCRHIVGTNRRNLDSPRPVMDAVDHGLYPEAVEPLARWRAIKDSYEPRTVPVWLHDFAAEAAAAWLDEAGICWTEHDSFAQRVSKLSGAPYFSSEARAANGIHLMDASGPVLASWHSCGEGLNLQKWHRNLITSPPNNGKILEQILGRTHREGQRTSVSAEWFCACPEHDVAFSKALSDARYVEATLGLQQKTLAAEQGGAWLG